MSIAGEIGYLAAKFVAGGTLVVAFALIAQFLEPKRFSGIFSAGPSVLLASLMVTLLGKGTDPVRLTVFGSIGGAAGLVAYSLTAIWSERWKKGVLGALVPLVPWFGVAAGAYFLILRGRG